MAYAAARHELEEVIGQAVGVLADGDGGGEQPWLFNPAPVDRAEVVSVPEAAASGLPGQTLADGAVAVFARIPAAAGTPLTARADNAPAARVEITETTLDNGMLRVELNNQGLLTSIRDLIADREVLAPGAMGNLLQLHPDLPNAWDAWDIDRHYLHRHVDVTRCDSLAVVEAGPLVGAIRVERSSGRPPSRRPCA